MKKNRLGESPINHFGFETAKGYIFADLIAFHIVPLMFIIMGMEMLYAMPMMLMTANPVFVVIVSLIYGMRQGFTWKFPVFTAVIFAPSIIMYYMPLTTSEEIMYAILSTTIYTLVYLIFSFIAIAVGGWLKKYLHG